MQFGDPYLIRFSFFLNPVRSGFGSELQNQVGSCSENQIIFNTAARLCWARVKVFHKGNGELRKLFCLG